MLKEQLGECVEIEAKLGGQREKMEEMRGELEGMGEEKTAQGKIKV